ncbi:DEAD/DEAH box helicase [Streptomyces sp. AC495_CC817]|uniref:DEAD/DEAH box helicase family protein n=1 Tax=Streptomyces sp. AC495_CC817 TaxID=2823900 RepID=UPI001C272777|nr:DEAD/DEAH box helicase [Streptomyces sp. AC495_CC817]
MTRHTPHDYQEDAIQKILAEPTRAALIGDEVGLGKTLLATEVVLRADWRRVIIIGIPDTFEQWKSTVEGQSEGARTVRRMDSTKAGREAYEEFLAGADGIFFAGIHWLVAQDFTHRDKLDFEGKPIEKIDKKTGLGTGKNERERVHLETFRKMSNRKSGGVDAVLFDEAHAVANKDSIGRKTLITFRGRLGEDGKPTSPWKIAISATWGGNSFENAWSLPRWLWPDLVPAYWNWHDEWCATEDVYIPGKSKPISRVIGEKVPGTFVHTLPCYIDNRNDEKAPEPVIIRVEPTPQQAAQMRDLQADLMTWVETEAGETPLVVDVPGALYTRFKQLALAELTVDEDGAVSFAPGAASAKLRALKGVLDHWGAQPVFIVADSKLFVDLTVRRMQALGYNAIGWTGDTPKKERARIKEAFIAGEYQYLVGTVQSLGTGLDGLQRVCSKMVWLNLPDGDPKLKTQALGRVFRQGRTDKYGEFEHVQLVQVGSQDEHILERLLEKAASIHASVDSRTLAA